MECFQFCQDTQLPLHLQTNHLAYRVLQGQALQPLKGSSWELRRTIRKFISSLKPAHLSHLKLCGLDRLPSLLDKEIQWSLLGAAVERFNPLTNTFFFNCGEMSFLPEELHHFFPIDPIVSVIGFESIFGVSERIGKQERESLLLLLGVASGVESVVRGDSLNLSRLAERMLPLMGSEVGDDIQRISLAALYIVAGVFAFSTGDFTLSPTILYWLDKCWRRRSCEIGHAAIAHLIEGLSVASVGGPFSGFPYLLQGWLYAHFPFVRIRDIEGIAAPFLDAPRYSIVNHHRGYWRHYFDLVNSELSPPELCIVDRVQCPFRSEDECVLVGVESFVTIPIQRCVVQLNFGRGIPPPPSFKPWVIRRDVGTPADWFQVQSFLTHWACYSPLLIILPLYLPELRDEYVAWYGSFHEVLQAPVSERVAEVVAGLPSLEASGSQERPAKRRRGKKH